ncbi:hypothetical protein WICMUC_001083 [Wickerhamomyces mucosus]|uniref:Glutathione S-transferase n=1 Tax=Wickerhamomyces mucosus TaxID=1378264 RepID=A0A9P8PW05_9ASCO|nr:hypothetical protein WICMUC_001083 [Wickerhamomyces mucosus]
MSEPVTKKAKTMPVNYKDNDPKFPEGHEAPFLKLFTSTTTNGRKVDILLELIGQEYISRVFKDFRGETKESWFVELNPNKQIPVIEDVDAEGKPFILAESGAILQYIANKYDTEHKASYAFNTPLYWEQTQVLFFHASNLGPKQTAFNIGKANGVAEVDQLKAKLAEAYQFFEDKLAANSAGFLVGDHISLADIIAIAHAKGAAEPLEFDSKFPHLAKWVAKLSEIPAIKKVFT